MLAKTNHRVAKSRTVALQRDVIIPRYLYVTFTHTFMGVWIYSEKHNINILATFIAPICIYVYTTLKSSNN